MHTVGTSVGSNNLEEQLKFARHHYENLQAIIRQIDTKAGVFITLLVFLATSTFPFVKDLSEKLHWAGKGAVTSWALVATCIVQVVGLLATAVFVHHVVRPRGSERASLSAGLMFWQDILSHSDTERYHAVVEAATQNVLLKSMTSEMFQLSLIIKRKTDALNIARIPTFISFAGWGVCTLLSVYISTWK